MQTQRYKRIIAVFLTFLMILATTSYTAHAATMDTDTMAAQSTGTVSGGNSTDTTGTSLGTITAITDSDGLPIESSYAVTVSAGDSAPLDELLWKVLRVYATVEGKTETVTLNVDWDYNSLTANLDTPGEYTHCLHPCRWLYLCRWSYAVSDHCCYCYGGRGEGT